MTTTDTRALTIHKTDTALIQLPASLPAQMSDAFMQAMEGMTRFIHDEAFQHRFAQLMLTELLTKPALQSCTPESFIHAVILIAEAGLDPSAMNECFLVPYQGAITVQIGYGGLIKLACAHPDVL